jgi:hypothetical protein
MNLPDDTKALLRAFEARFPLPQGAPGEEHEEQCREWCIRFAQQARFTFPSRMYGVKRASPDRPISKDSLALLPLNDALVSWDLMLGAGTGRPTLAPEPKFHSIPSQVFVAVAPRDYLEGGGVPVPPGPDPGPAPAPAPGKPHDDVTALAVKIGDAFSEGYGLRDLHVTLIPGFAEIVASLVWRYQHQGESADALIATARARGVEAAGG